MKQWIHTEFSELEPEFPDASVGESNMLVFHHDHGRIEVIVYFMVNNALRITDGKAYTPGMGQIKLQCFGHSPSGAVTCSVALRKVRFLFPDAQGMGGKFDFLGLKIEG